MKVYELVEACNDPYESWDNGIALYQNKEKAEQARDEMDKSNTTDLVYYVTEREVLQGKQP